MLNSIAAVKNKCPKWDGTLEEKPVIPKLIILKVWNKDFYFTPITINAVFSCFSVSSNGIWSLLYAFLQYDTCLCLSLTFGGATAKSSGISSVWSYLYCLLMSSIISCFVAIFSLKHKETLKSFSPANSVKVAINLFTHLGQYLLWRPFGLIQQASARTCWPTDRWPRR